MSNRKEISIRNIKYNCRYFKGDIPCKPHKDFGVHCIDVKGKTCKYYERTDRKILIIKLGAIGDVIRTTTLLPKIKKVYPKAEIWWLTLSPEVLPKLVDVILPFTPQSIVTLEAVNFDVIYNLDKDKEACGLTSKLKSRVKKGFTLKNGKCVPINSDAEHKYMTGIFDDVSKANRKSYQEEIFEICGFKFSGEEYVMPEVKSCSWKLPKERKIVGLNTGCGGRWTSRLWPDEYWIRLAKELKKSGYVPLLLGGEQEHNKNIKLAKKSGAIYLGHFSINQFIDEVEQCELVVTAVTMAMHIAIGLKKKLVLFNNIFNKHEFELYGRGVILEPDFKCDCYYSPTCPNNCMQYLTVDKVFNACLRLLENSD